MTYLPDDVVRRLQSVVELPDLAGTRYELLGEIGRGGMGAVYLVRDRELERNAALKVAGSLDSEARLMAALEHPGIVPVYDAGVLPDGRTFYVMRFVEGRRLDEFCRETPNLAERLRVFQKVCDAVSFAHSRGVLHRDLKPQNIMAGPFGEVFVLDWGVARSARSRESPGLVVGTPDYMPPEQAAGDSHQSTVASDVYALGAVLATVLGPAAPKPLNAIVRQACQDNPADRYAEVQALNREITRYLELEPVLAYRESWRERLGRFAGKNRTLLLLLGAYLAVKLLLYFLRPG